MKIIWPGDVLTARGRVAERRFEEGGRYATDIEVWAENQRGELVVRGVATVQLYYSADDEQRQRSGLPPLVVTPAEEEARLARFARTVPARPGMLPRPGALPLRPGIGTPAPAAASAAASPAAPTAAPELPAAAQVKPPKPRRRGHEAGGREEAFAARAEEEGGQQEGCPAGAEGASPLARSRPARSAAPREER